MKCLCAGIRRAARLLTNYYEIELRETGLTPSQFELLGMLYAHAEISQADLAEALALDQTTLSRNMKLLVGNQWVHYSTSKKDKRRSVCKLSAEGRELFLKAIPHWQRAQRTVHANLGTDWEKIWPVLEKLTKTTPAK